jgi:predicted PurR-regulated permease PerM
MTENLPPPYESEPTSLATMSRLERGIAAVLLGGLAIACFFVLAPFIAAILWAGILVFATWPIFSRLRGRFGGRAGAAAGVMILAAFAVTLAPLALVIADFADEARSLVAAGREVFESGLPAPPAWINEVPFIGATIHAEWTRVAADRGELAALVAPYLQALGRFGFDAGKNVTIGLATGALEIGLALFIAFFLYRDGEFVRERIAGGLVRVAGARGERLLAVAAGTVRSVVYGVLGTAFVQGLLMLVGLLIAGVPHAMLLAFITCLVSPLPIGAPIVWIGAAIWLYLTSGWGWTIFMLVWGTGLVSMADNVVRPILISRGGSTPIVIVLLGIIGGVLAFGFLGIFVGPTLLALAYSLIQEWTAPSDAKPPA